jgi:hypothetical protein
MSNENAPFRYDHIPGDAAYLLQDWTYKGVRPTVRQVGPIMPTVAFSTVDLKMPAKGPVKILELNGYDSGLDAYGEERSDASIIERVNAINSALYIPVGAGQ